MATTRENHGGGFVTYTWDTSNGGKATVETHHGKATVEHHHDKDGNTHSHECSSNWYGGYDVSPYTINEDDD